MSLSRVRPLLGRVLHQKKNLLLHSVFNSNNYNTKVSNNQSLLSVSHQTSIYTPPLQNTTRQFSSSTTRNHQSSSHDQNNNGPRYHIPKSLLALILFASIGTAGASLIINKSSNDDGTNSSSMIVFVSAEELQQEETKSVDNVQYFTLDQVSQHNSIQNGVWVIFKGGVYNVTEFIESHPGGTDKIM